MKMNLIRVEGRIEVQNLGYKGVEMEELVGNVLLSGGQLTVRDLRVKAAGGEGTGEFIYGFEPEKVRFWEHDLLFQFRNFLEFLEPSLRKP